MTRVWDICPADSKTLSISDFLHWFLKTILVLRDYESLGRRTCIRRSEVRSTAETSCAAVIAVAQAVRYKPKKFIFTVYHPIFQMRLNREPKSIASVMPARNT